MGARAGPSKKKKWNWLGHMLKRSDESTAKQ